MAGKQINGIHGWMNIIVDPHSESETDPTDYGKLFKEDLTRLLYEELKRISVGTPSPLNRNFTQLAKSEKKIWYRYVSDIPPKLISLGLRIRPSGVFYRSCIITDEDIEKLVIYDKDKYSAFNSNLPDGTRFFRELNNLIPPQLKKIGYEIFRPGEDPLIKASTIKKLARAIHSRYLKERRDKEQEHGYVYPGDYTPYLQEFDELPEEIKFSNIDNAHHIATKLISIGYTIKPAREGFQPKTLILSENEIETMAKIEHIRWSWDKRLSGWIYGSTKNNFSKTHPGLIPYEELSDSEKEKDRELVRIIPSLLHDIGYIADPIDHEKIKELSYAVRQRSSIHRLLTETRLLNEEIRDISAGFPLIREKIKAINSKIEETINEVQGNYNYARHIQEKYLPDDLFIRECFPDSFIFYKPRDIVSGDFYFFTSRKNLRIFGVGDCTGHGIPGAILSTLGYGITDQAINEAKLTSPSEILCHLYSRVHKFFRKDDDNSDIHDDMDIAACSLDIDTNELLYAGVSLPLFRISKGELIEYQASNFSDSCDGGNPFTHEKIKVEKGDLIYIFSDGFADQFGGENHKKYQRTRFKSFLNSIHNLPLSEQKDLLFEEFESWRGKNNEDQTDDILVVGLKV